MTDYLLLGIVAHLIADWMFQTEWQARNKTCLTHRAAWVHGSIHGIAALLVFGWFPALAIAAAHMLIDTRRPLVWWRETFKQTTTGEFALHVAIWQDQVAHIAVIALMAWLVTL